MYWRLIENARLGHADVLQALAQRVLVEFLGAGEVDLADGRPLLDDDHQDAVLLLHAHVAKEAGGVERLDRGRGLLVVDPVADLDGQVVEDGAGLGPLHALDADVPDRERVERHRRRRRQRREQAEEQRQRRLDPGGRVRQDGPHPSAGVKGNA
jgi:hypothetical protein